ncbi:MAG: glycosyltransferase family 4 protein [Pseudomonadota bacterium]
MNINNSTSLLVWIFQTGEPLQIDDKNARPMRAVSLSNSLLDAGHKVVLWSTDFYHQEKRHRYNKYKRIKMSDKFEIRLIPTMGYKRNIGIGRLLDHAQLAFRLKKLLSEEESSPDIAFIGFPPIETAYLLAKWLKKRDIPSILDVKDLWPVIFLDPLPKLIRPLGKLALFPYFYLAKKAIKDVTGVTTMANKFLDSTLGFIGREKTNKDGVFFLTSPKFRVSDSQLNEARKWWDSKGIIDNGKHRLCFIGSLSYAFDFHPIYKAAKIALEKNNNIEIIICGEGSCSEKIKKMMSGLSNVHFPGWIDRPKIETLAKRCIGSLAPYINIDSFINSIPNKIIDALSLGLPILSPLKGEVASIINQHNVGLKYDSDGDDSLYNCLKILQKDNELRKAMAKNALNLYEDQFSFEKTYDSLVKHLETLASY